MPLACPSVQSFNRSVGAGNRSVGSVGVGAERTGTKLVKRAGPCRGFWRGMHRVHHTASGSGTARARPTCQESDRTERAIAKKTTGTTKKGKVTPTRGNGREKR